jgi:hypothetical protein
MNKKDGVTSLNHNIRPCKNGIMLNLTPDLFQERLMLSLSHSIIYVILKGVGNSCVSAFFRS